MRASSWVVFASAIGLYWAFPSTLWNFDGVACAAALEYGDPTYFFHSQHLFYGFFGWLFWKPIHWIVPTFRALPALQILTPVFSAIGLVALWKTLLATTKDWRLAGLLTVIAGVSPVFWVWSIEAQVYSLGFMGLAWATYYALTQGVQGNEGRIAFWHAVAILGHAMHLLWVIPVSCVLYRQSGSFRRYFLYLGVFTLLPYLGVMAAVILPSGKGLDWIWIWLKGSLGLTPQRHFAWHWGGWMGPIDWAKGFFVIFSGAFWPYAVEATKGIWALTWGSLAILGWGLGRSMKSRNTLEWNFSWMWLAAYGALLITWEPTTECYRMPEIFPLVLLLALGLRNTAFLEWSRRAAALAAAAITMVSFQTRIRPMQHISNNATFTQALRAARETPPDSKIMTRSSLLQMYILYFTGRAAYYQPGAPR